MVGAYGWKATDGRREVGANGRWSSKGERSRRARQASAIQMALYESPRECLRGAVGAESAASESILYPRTMTPSTTCSLCLSCPSSCVSVAEFFPLPGGVMSGERICYDCIRTRHCEPDSNLGSFWHETNWIPTHHHDDVFGLLVDGPNGGLGVSMYQPWSGFHLGFLGVFDAFADLFIACVDDLERESEEEL